jgi:hypothetical protein
VVETLESMSIAEEGEGEAKAAGGGKEEGGKERKKGGKKGGKKGAKAKGQA